MFKRKSVTSMIKDYLKKGQWEEALKKCEEGLTDFPIDKEINGYFSEAKIHYICERKKEAEEYITNGCSYLATDPLKKILFYEPHHSWAKQQLDRCENAEYQEELSKEQTRMLIDKAKELSVKGDLEQALLRLNAIADPSKSVKKDIERIEEQIQQAKTAFGKAEGEIDHGNLKEATRFVVKGTKIFSQSPEIVRLESRIKSVEWERLREKANREYKNENTGKAMKIIDKLVDDGIEIDNDSDLKQIKKAYIVQQTEAFQQELTIPRFKDAKTILKRIRSYKPDLADKLERELVKAQKTHAEKQEQKLQKEIEKGLNLSDSGDWEKARFHFEHLQKRYHADSSVHRCLQMVQEKEQEYNKRLDRTEQLLEEGALPSARDILEGLPHTARVRALRNKIDDTLKSIDEHFDRAKRAEKEGNLKNGLEALGAVKRLYPVHPTVDADIERVKKKIRFRELLEQSCDQADRGHYDEALRLLDEAQQLQPQADLTKEREDIQIRIDRRILSNAEELLKNGNFSQAEKSLKSIKTPDMHTKAKERLDDLEELRLDLEEKVSLAETAFKAGRIGEAQTGVSEVLQSYPDYFAARDLYEKISKEQAFEEKFSRAKALYEKNELQDARTLLQEIADEFPHQEKAAELLRQTEKAFTLSGPCMVMVYDHYQDYTLLPGDEYSIGGGQDNTIRLEGVSPNQAMIFRRNNQFLLKNSKTHHPITVNGNSEDHFTLTSGDVIRFENGTELSFVIKSSGGGLHTAVLTMEKGRPEDMIYILMGQRLAINNSREAEIVIHNDKSLADKGCELLYENQNYYLNPIMENIYIDDEICTDKKPLSNLSNIRMGTSEFSIEALS
jgi:hypothetical protein